MKTIAPLACLTMALLTASLSVMPARAGVFDLETKLTASDAAEDDRFGRSVAISGNTALVGAWRNDDGGLDSGSAYLFKSTFQPGDFDEDGDVDGADFLAWQRGESPDSLSAEDLADWEDNFGTAPNLLSASAPSSTTVPEPSTLLLLLLGSLGVLRRGAACYADLGEVS